MTEKKRETQNEIDAQAGTYGVPSATNRFVTDQDPRLAGGGAPLVHGATHVSNGTDPIPNATTAVGGLHSAADKAKLDSILAGYIEALAGTSGIPSLLNKYVTDNDIRLQVQPSSLVYAPSIVSPLPGQYNDWATLYADYLLIPTPVDIALVENCTIPAGTWTFQAKDRFVGPGFNQITVDLDDGCVFVGLTEVQNGLVLRSNSSSPIIVNSHTAVGINLFRLGNRCSLQALGSAPFIVNQQTLDTGVFVVVTDINGALLAGASPVVLSEHVSGAQPVATIITSVTAGIIEPDTVATAGASEFALVQFQQIGFEQAQFSLDQPNCSSSLGSLQSMQTYISSPGVPLQFTKATSNLTLPSPYSVVLCDTTAGNVTVTQLLPISELPNGAMWAVGKASSDANVVYAAPASGSGDTINGLPVDALPNPGETRFYMADAESNNWALAFAGNQTAATPPTPPASDVQIFTSNGTWTAPVGAKSIRVIAIGGGGGGGGGACAPLGSNRSGGGGGGGGGLVIRDFTNNEWGATESVQIGAGGSGGGAGVSSGSNGGPGSTGNPTLFGTLVKADGGGGGGAGTNGAMADGGSGAFTTSVGGTDPYNEGSFKSNWGGRSHFNLNADWGYTAGILPGGGGGGGGLDATETIFLAGNGGMGDVTVNATGIARGDAGVAGGAPPTAGGDGSAYNAGGGGGGGGAASDDDTVTAQSGETGGLYGGGGGGGGAAISGNTADAGAGGAGADGVCVIISYL